MKKFLFAAIFLTSFNVSGQVTDDQNSSKKDFGKVYGGFESNSQWYLNDGEMNTVQPEDPIRSNSYLFVNYNYKNWTAGIQVESYESNALLNYNPKYNETNVATYFLNYKNSMLDVTAGYFYEQFGSGMILRSWEDRALGINNAIRGGRIVFTPINSLAIKGIYGQQRSGFDVSDSKIYGLDIDYSLDDLMKFQSSSLSLGFSFVGRDEEIAFENPMFDEMTKAYSGRLNFSHNSFYLSSEYNYKSDDAVLIQQGNTISNEFVKPGSSLLFNTGYAKNGLGIDATFRRMENMGFFTERIPEYYGIEQTSLSFNDKMMNYVPALTKQHHSNLANIYVYQAQNKVDFPDPTVMKVGEIGGQIDVFYNFKKGTVLGGKYGTKVAVNVSNWYNLKGTTSYYDPLPDYDNDFFGSSDKYFSDYNIEIFKKFSDKWHTGLVYVNQYYNKRFIEGGALVKTNILNAEATYSFSPTRSIKFGAEHMWADADKKNWAGATVEFNLNSRFSFYVWDIYNYGNDNPDQRNHYYNLGGSYRKGSSRIGMNYGRQRGGLVCVGGVCRYVPESTGLSLSLNTSF